MTNNDLIITPRQQVRETEPSLLSVRTAESEKRQKKLIASKIVEL